MDNYLEAEDLIVARLKTELPANVTVASASDIAGVEEKAQKTPAAYVVFDGDDIGGFAGEGSNQVIRQRWMVVVTVRNRNNKSAKGAREDAGVLVSQVINALAGHRLQGGQANYRPMERVGAVSPGYSEGFAYFPLTFAVTTATRPA